MSDIEKNEDDITNINTHPDMTKWFSFRVLKNAANRVILSSVFGEYADRRLIQAALDINKEAYSPITESNDDFWVDYVADLGDGFDSTYSIAYLLGQKEIKVDGLPET